MKTILWVSLCAVITSVSARAANIVWVSFHSGDNSPSANAAAAGFTQAPDVGYTTLLANNGHTVTRFVTKEEPTAADAAFLNGFDLIIISRSVPSGNYQSATERIFWNTTITRPVINMGGYTLRGSRLGLTSGETIPDTTSDISLQAAVPTHPIFNGIALGAGNVMVNSFAGITTFNAVTQRGISVNSSPLAGGGTILATIGTGTIDNPANLGTGMIIAQWTPGSVTQTGNALGGHRMVFLSGSREMGITSEGAGIFDLAPDGQAMFLNAVTYMSTIPEPSTYVLLGIGALVLAWRWKRS
jgi:hypothetical protein